MEEDEPLTVRVMFPPTVEEPLSPTYFHSSQRFIQPGAVLKDSFFILTVSGIISFLRMAWTVDHLPCLGPSRRWAALRWTPPLPDPSLIPSPATPVSLFCSLWVACGPWSPTSCSVRARTLWPPATPCNVRPHNPSGPLLRLTSCAFPCHGGFTSTSSFKRCKPSSSSSGGGAEGTLVKFLLLAAVFQLVLQTPCS